MTTEAINAERCPHCGKAIHADEYAVWVRLPGRNTPWKLKERTPSYRSLREAEEFCAWLSGIEPGVTYRVVDGTGKAVSEWYAGQKSEASPPC